MANHRVSSAGMTYRQSQLNGFGVRSSILPGATAVASAQATARTTVAQTTGRQRGDGGRPSGNSTSTSGTSPQARVSVTFPSQAASYPPGWIVGATNQAQSW
jgi:hypothetical protein